MNKVLLTGSTGFIGKKLVSAMELKDIYIRAVSREKHAKLESITCDLRTGIFSPDLMEGIDTVIHLAGIAHDSSKLDEDFYKVNVVATQKLCELAAEHGVKRFVFVSSVKSGGSSKSGLCASELDQEEPDGIYGKTKREAELRLLAIGMNSKIDVSILRPALVYGPGAKGNIALMMKGIKRGWFPPFPLVKNKRSLVHVDDVVRAILFISESEKAKGEIFILTDRKSYTTRDVYEVMCKSNDKKVPNWTVPEFCFKFIAHLSPGIKHKVDKLMGDDYYSSKKLKLIGFQSQKTLKDINETIF